LGTPQQVALRCRIILAAAHGESESAIASNLGVNRKTVRLWRERFSREGLNGFWEIAPGRGSKATYGPDRIKAVIDATLQSKPKGHTHWSCRLMAASQGISKSTVSNLWKSHNIKPHRTSTFKLSRDPKFLEKLSDVVGLYLDQRNAHQAIPQRKPRFAHRNHHQQHSRLLYRKKLTQLARTTANWLSGQPPFAPGRAHQP
jgi:transposase-like protein